MWITFGIIVGAVAAVTVAVGTVTAAVASNRPIRAARKELKASNKQLKRARKLQKRLNKWKKEPIQEVTRTQDPAPEKVENVKSLKELKTEIFKRFSNEKLRPISDGLGDISDKNPDDENVKATTKTIDNSFARMGAMIDNDNISVETFEEEINKEYKVVEEAYNNLVSQMNQKTEVKEEVKETPDEVVEETPEEEVVEEVEETPEEEEVVEEIKETPEEVKKPTKKELKEQAKALKAAKQKVYDDLYLEMNMDVYINNIKNYPTNKNPERIGLKKDTVKSINKLLHPKKNTLNDSSVSVEQYTTEVLKRFRGIMAHHESIYKEVPLMEALNKVDELLAKNKELEGTLSETKKHLAEVEQRVEMNTTSISNMNETLKTLSDGYESILSSVESINEAVEQDSKKLATLETIVKAHGVELTKTTARSKKNAKGIQEVRKELTKNLNEFKKVVDQRFSQTNKNVKKLDKDLNKAIKDLKENLSYMFKEELEEVRVFVSKVAEAARDENQEMYNDLIEVINQKIAVVDDVVQKQGQQMGGLDTRLGAAETKIDETSKLAKQTAADLENLRSRVKEKFSTVFNLLATKTDDAKFVEHKQSVQKQLFKFKEDIKEIKKGLHALTTADLVEIRNNIEKLTNQSAENEKLFKGMLADLETKLNNNVNQLTSDIQKLGLNKEQVAELEKSLKTMIGGKASTADLVALESKLGSLEEAIVNKFKGELVEIVKNELNDSKSAVRAAIKEDIKARIDQKFYKNKNYKKMKEFVENQENFEKQVIAKVLEEIKKSGFDLTDEQLDKLVAKVAESLIVKPKK